MEDEDMPNFGENKEQDLPAYAETKEDSAKYRIQLAKVPVPEGTIKWMRYWRVEDGNLIGYTQPFVVKKVSAEEQARRDKIQKERFEKLRDEGKLYGMPMLKPEDDFVEYRRKMNATKKIRAIEEKQQRQKERIETRIKEQEQRLAELKSKL